jgi:protein-S-isoprenylcysteine O-methyltransferase Ste14
MVIVVAPGLILWRAGTDVDVVPAIVGAALIALGLVLVVWTVKLFVTAGRGTLAPWDATTKLVVQGPYRHVRNPMITGVVLILVGEAVVFQSWGLVILFAVFVMVNAIYFPLVEEPGLSRRFGHEYDVYRAQVPRWLPRRRPWTAPEER